MIDFSQYELVRQPVPWSERLLNASAVFVEMIFLGLKSVFLAPVAFGRQIITKERVFIIQKPTADNPVELIQSPDDKEDWKREHDALYGDDKGV